MNVIFKKMFLCQISWRLCEKLHRDQKMGYFLFFLPSGIQTNHTSVSKIRRVAYVPLLSEYCESLRRYEVGQHITKPVQLVRNGTEKHGSMLAWRKSTPAQTSQSFCHLIYHWSTFQKQSELLCFPPIPLRCYRLYKNCFFIGFIIFGRNRDDWKGQASQCGTS